MSAAENVRSFWLAKTRSESASAIPRFKDGPTMEGLRSTLQKSTPVKALELPSKVVTNNVFKERDQTPSPSTSPKFGRRSPFAKDISNLPQQNTAISALPRPSSPYKSAMASPEVGPHQLSRSKSVTFNESLEVRHMSECSFDEASSPYLADSDLEENDDSFVENLSDLEEELPQPWHDRNEDKSNDVDVKDSTVPRALPVIPGPRPLPDVPAKLANSPESRILATEQENLRKPFVGLGLNLASGHRDESVTDQHLDSSLYNADEAIIRRNSKLTKSMTNDDRNDLGGKSIRSSMDEIEISCPTTSTSTSTSEESPAVEARHAGAIPRSYMHTRSAEPAISREHIKEKLAQRKAAKEIARQENGNEAFTPHVILAPPLSHYDSFVKANSVDIVNHSEQDSDDSTFPAVIIPQRKVSDLYRPSTPTEQITLTSPEPQSGRAIHHEREKRISIDISQEKPPASPKHTFTAINYDGDDYDTDPEYHDDLIIRDIHTGGQGEHIDLGDNNTIEMPQSFLHAEIESTNDTTVNAKHDNEPEHSPLQFLKEIPDIPARNIHEIATDPLSRSNTFDMKHMSLSLDALGEDFQGLGLEQYMTPELRPETPITSRTVANESPTKFSEMPSQLESWVNTTEGPNKENTTEPEIATITSRGMKLRTRPSITPADATALAARRRQVSLELEGQTSFSYGPDVTLHNVRKESVGESSVLSDENQQLAACHAQIENSDEPTVMETILPMAMPVLQPLTRELSFSDINSAFDRVMQKQKKGYVIREQTRVVHATANHEEHEQAQNDATKGHTRQSSSVYTTASEFAGRVTENHKTHSRKGSRVPVGVGMSPKPRATPTLPAPQSPILQDLDGGRLFIRVMHVKRLTLPIPKGEESFFSCTLDNGKHCVTTPLHTLAETVKINQEFELIADHDLEFILTLQAQYVAPKMPPRPKSTLGRLLNSPKRHKPTGSITSLSLAGYVADDGSFARAHIALKHFRNKAFGRPYTMLIPVLNEWAMETTGMISKNVPQVRQRKPYKIGEIELQVLYVPPVATEQRHALPTSLSQAVRDMRDAEWHSAIHCEGYLSQQGGDCPYWRRRHFRLIGSKLIAYHANTGQVRATINLAKALNVTDDKETLTVAEVTVGKGDHQKRRKSGFAEREEGHLYVADGFRLRFANGEIIDFYADSHSEKTKWVDILGKIVQKIPLAKQWCQTVLESEAAIGGIAKIVVKHGK